METISPLCYLQIERWVLASPGQVYRIFTTAKLNGMVSTVSLNPEAGRKGACMYTSSLLHVS